LHNAAMLEAIRIFVQADKKLPDAFDYGNEEPKEPEGELATLWAGFKARYLAGEFHLLSRDGETSPAATGDLHLDLGETCVGDDDCSVGVTEMAAMFKDTAFVMAMYERDRRAGLAVESLLGRGLVREAREAFDAGHELNLSDTLACKYDHVVVEGLEGMASRERPVCGTYPFRIHLNRVMFRGDDGPREAGRALAFLRSSKALSCAVHCVNAADFEWWVAAGMDVGNKCGRDAHFVLSWYQQA
jgi:hypothetical protein